MKTLIGLFFIFLLSSCNPNFYLATDIYSNGQPKYEGKYIICETPDPNHPQIIIQEKRKFGKWISYYPNGEIREIRHYTTNVKDCRSDVLREGIWSYYNHEGVLYLEEQYRNDTLVSSVYDIYDNTTLTGKLFKDNINGDNLIFYRPIQTGQIVANPDFDQYYYKPVSLINSGQDQIETLIPRWYSPDKATPDYYNGYRSVEGIPPHFNPSKSLDTNDGYIGLMLYIGEGIRDKYIIPDYSESLQTELLQSLQKDKNYCFKIRIRLSENSGYSINRFGVLFSDEAIYFDNTKTLDSASVTFAQELNSTGGWETLCSNYLANGNEKYMTLGRFSNIENLGVEAMYFKNESSLDVNESAYYLLNDIALFTVLDSAECNCNNPHQNLELQDYVEEQYSVGDTVIIDNILFKFDSYELNDSAFTELDRLYKYLLSSPQTNLEITGHTDNVGNDSYNLQLSKQRAVEVGKWLIERGIDPTRIKTSGVGNRLPIRGESMNSKFNRRVEIVLTL